MENREAEGLDYKSMAEDLSVFSSMSENRPELNRCSYPGLSSPGNHLKLLRPSPENHYFQPENNHQFHINPRFQENPYEFLEPNFSRLSLSDPLHQSPFVGPSAIFGGGPNLGNNSLYDSSIRNMDLQRLRVQSAVRGQMGSAINGFPTPIRPTPNRNSFQSAHNFCFGAPNCPNRNGFQSNHDFITGSESENSGVLNSSFRRRPESGSEEELRGKMFLAVATDQNGGCFLQRKLERGKVEEIEMIFLEVKNHVWELMVDKFGSYLVQKLFEVCNEEQMSQILLLVFSDDRGLVAICLDMHGTRAIQKLIENLTTQEQRSLVVSVLRRITVTLTKSMNGHHVIQHCLKFFSNEDIKHILNVVAESCVEIATDKSGCCVLQQCVAHAQGVAKERLVAEITANALVLSEHVYGNYVVQYLLGVRIPQVTADILAQLVGSFVSLSMNKYGSNVVEKCLRESSEVPQSRIIEEIINSPTFLMLLQDPYGNYVAQSALAMAKGSLRQRMSNLIQIHYPFLHSHPHGKRVLARTRGSKKIV